MNHNLLQKAAYGFSWMRSGTFLVENLTLPLLEYISTGNSKFTDPSFSSQFKVILDGLNTLLRKDSENIANGLYPIEVLRPSRHAFGHVAAYVSIIEDAFGLSKRKRDNKNKEFSREAQSELADSPDYYRRNFHFQTDGYVSDKSARIYDHQVEILFSGAANPMRRLMLLPVRRYFDQLENSKDGEGLHFLEIGAGTGALTRFMKMTFPKLKITLLDLSAPYLKEAGKNLRSFSGLNYIQGDANDLPFKDATFDGVYSCFLFHELPQKVRNSIVKENLRVLRQGGLYAALDSIQLGDAPRFDWALQKFPTDFHEPFFKNYSQHKMEDLFANAGLEKIETDQEFLSKAVTGIKA